MNSSDIINLFKRYGYNLISFNDNKFIFYKDLDFDSENLRVAHEYLPFVDKVYCMNYIKNPVLWNYSITNGINFENVCADETVFENLESYLKQIDETIEKARIVYKKWKITHISYKELHGDLNG